LQGEEDLVAVQVEVSEEVPAGAAAKATAAGNVQPVEAVHRLGDTASLLQSRVRRRVSAKNLPESQVPRRVPAKVMEAQVQITSVLPQRHQKAVIIPAVHRTSAHRSGEAVLSVRKMRRWKRRGQVPPFRQRA